MSTTEPIEQVTGGPFIIIDNLHIPYVVIDRFEVRAPANAAIVNPLFPPPSRQSQHHFQNILCDHLLIPILEQQSLLDLFAIANVCTGFNALADNVFKRKTNGILSMRDVYPNGRGIWVIDEFLQRFGKLITEVHSNRLLMSSLPIQLTFKYCPNIIRISCTQQTIVLPNQHYPQLKELVLDKCKLRHLPSTEAFFMANSQLEVLSLSSLDNSDNNRMGRYRRERLPNWDADKTFVHLKQLRELRLQLYEVHEIEEIFSALVSGNVQLNRLEMSIVSGNIWDLIRSTCHFKSLKILHTSTTQTVEDNCLMQISRELNHLTEIQFEQCRINFGTIRYVIEALKQLKNVRIQMRLSNEIRIDDIKTIDEMRKSRAMEINVSVIVREITEVCCVHIVLIECVCVCVFLLIQLYLIVFHFI